ncbi:MAG: hypothetical protein MI867_14590 [Pseudomonadales bacterium]|nr:hypothetical protein [Pseudomonadales bacterium]
MKLQWFTLIFLMFGVTAYANGMHPRHEPNFARLAEQINVNEAQMDAFINVMKEQHAQRKEIHKEGRDAVKSKMDALHRGLLTKLEAILTEPQLDELKDRMEKRRQKREKYRLLNVHKGNCCKRGQRHNSNTEEPAEAGI